MKIVFGPFTLTATLDYKPASLRAAVIKELKASSHGQMIYAVKRAREVDPKLTLKAALEYVRSVREQEGL